MVRLWPAPSIAKRYTDYTLLCSIDNDGDSGGGGGFGTKGGEDRGCGRVVNNGMVDDGTVNSDRDFLLDHGISNDFL